MSNDAVEPVLRPSPLAPRSLLKLFFQPSKFFAPGSRILKKPELFFVVWMAGLAYSIDRIDSRLLREDLGSPSESGAGLGSWLDSWLYLWLFSVAVAFPFGYLTWLIAGWWYRKRIEWSGEPSPLPELARAVWAYQNLVVALPAVVLLAIQTSIFQSYREAWSAPEVWSSAWVIFPLWSCVVSFRAVVTRFSVSPGLAFLWFLVLPVALYLALFVVLAL